MSELIGGDILKQELIDLFNNIISFLKIVSPYLLTIFSAYIGYRFGVDQFRKQKNLEFVERQLREFYSPMIGCLNQIQAKSELRYEISKASDVAWKEIVARHPRPFEDHEKYFEPFKKSMLYDNNQLRNELIPLYDRMITLFSENYWLAEPETRKWYSELSTFVDLWHRWLDETIPSEVIRKMDHTEARLKPFYENLNSSLERLQKIFIGK